MTLKIFGWMLILCSIAPFALLVHQMRSRVTFAKRHRSVSQTARFAQVGSWLGRAKLSSSSAGNLKVAAVVFLVVAGMGAARSYWGQLHDVAASADMQSELQSDSPVADEPDGDLAQLASYASSVSGEKPATPETADGKLLPDVSTMIERLAARLESEPDNVQGWRMLGWSYVNMGRYDDAVRAYEKAVALDPNSPEVKRLYEDAKAKAAGGASAETAAPSQPDALGADEQHAHAVTSKGACAARDRCIRTRNGGRARGTPGAVSA